MPRRCERALSGRSSLASSGIGAAAGALISKGGGEARRRRWQQQDSEVVESRAAVAVRRDRAVWSDYIRSDYVIK